MPIYEYQCQECHTNFELIRPMKEADSSAACINYQSENVKRKISRSTASSEGRAITGSSGCSRCTGGTCSTCGSH
jgi:putative FmdB family regulatory protein